MTGTHSPETPTRADGDLRDEFRHGAIIRSNRGAVTTLTFSRPHAHNAFTEQMYDELTEVLVDLQSSNSLRALVFRGEGGLAFSAGTDAQYIATMNTPALGVRYERLVTELLARIESLRMPTLAVVTGHCYGAGLLVASACDIRITTQNARFGVPVAQTLGNCLSAESLSLLRDRLGSNVVLDMLVRAAKYSTHDLTGTRFVTVESSEDSLEQDISDILEQLLSAAPLTVWATKEMLSRMRTPQFTADEVVGAVYGSNDFAAGTKAFLNKTRPAWRGH